MTWVCTMTTTIFSRFKFVSALLLLFIMKWIYLLVVYIVTVKILSFSGLSVHWSSSSSPLFIIIRSLLCSTHTFSLWLFQSNWMHHTIQKRDLTKKKIIFLKCFFYILHRSLSLSLGPFLFLLGGSFATLTTVYYDRSRKSKLRLSDDNDESSSFKEHKQHAHFLFCCRQLLMMAAILKKKIK